MTRLVTRVGVLPTFPNTKRSINRAAVVPNIALKYSGVVDDFLAASAQRSSTQTAAMPSPQAAAVSPSIGREQFLPVVFTLTPLDPRRIDTAATHSVARLAPNSFLTLDRGTSCER